MQTICSHFGTCGGCSSQTTLYETQCLQKEQSIAELFGCRVDPIIPCATPWQYRNKMEFSFSQSKMGERFLGLMQRGKQRVVHLAECLLTPPWFVKILKDVFIWWEKSGLAAYFAPADRGTLRTLTVREGKRTRERMAILTISGEISESLLESFEAAIGAGIDTLILRRQVTARKMATHFEERVLKGSGFIHEEIQIKRKWRFKIGPSSFFQPNTEQAEVLFKHVIDHVDGAMVFDLFCGIGTMGILASTGAEKIIGIEIGVDAVKDAEENVLINGVKNMRFYQGDVASLLKDIVELPDIVIVDPPRAGLGQKTIHLLKALVPKKLIYVSCNPKTQAADCIALGFPISKIQPVDQFPHTPHVENIVILEV